jgi:RHS repeat-associated protein
MKAIEKQKTNCASMPKRRCSTALPFSISNFQFSTFPLTITVNQTIISKTQSSPPPYVLPFSIFNFQFSTPSTPYKFSAKEKEEETGYSYFGARYYWPEVSVWLSVDPLSDKYPSMSAYMYCAGNPVVLVDPDGRNIDEWNFNVNTGELTWESDKGGKDRQYVNVIQNDKKIGETSVSGDKVYAYRLRDCAVITNTDKKFNDETYNRNSGYSYSYEDFKARNTLFDNPSPISTAIQRSESNGKAMPLTYDEDVNQNGYTLMRLKMMITAIENGMQVPSFANKISFKKFGSSLNMAKVASSSTLQGNSGAVALSGKRSWNLFLQSNKGVYSGKGWQKRAAADYYKSDYYKP